MPLALWVLTASAPRPPRAFTALCYSADGQSVLAGGRSKFVCIYHVREQILRKRFEISGNLSLDAMEVSGARGSAAWTPAWAPGDLWAGVPPAARGLCVWPRAHPPRFPGAGVSSSHPGDAWPGWAVTGGSGGSHVAFDGGLGDPTAAGLAAGAEGRLCRKGPGCPVSGPVCPGAFQAGVLPPPPLVAPAGGGRRVSSLCL